MAIGRVGRAWTVLLRDQRRVRSRPHSAAACPPAEFFPLAQPVQDALNEQIGAELDASLGYLAMASSVSAVGVSLRGAGAMFLASAAEERGHAELLVRWLAARGGCLRPRDLRPAAELTAPPDRTWELLAEAIGLAVAMERQVTESLLRVHGVAKACRDVATADLMSRVMLAEQVEALHFLGHLHTRLQHVKDSPHGLRQLDDMLYQKFTG